jgi:hypothetical protein
MGTDELAPVFRQDQGPEPINWPVAIGSKADAVFAGSALMRVAGKVQLKDDETLHDAVVPLKVYVPVQGDGELTHWATALSHAREGLFVQ